MAFSLCISPVSSFFFLFFIEVELFYNVVLVSTVQQSGVPCAIQQVLISYLFYTYWWIYVNPNLPIHTSRPCFPRLVCICLFSTSVSLFLPCKLVHLFHFSRFHIYALIYDICFSLSDLLHSVWQSLGPSMSLQMTQFRSFLWLSNIPFYIYTTSSLSIRLSMGHLGCFHDLAL